MIENILYYIIIGFIKVMSILPQKIRRGFFFALARIAYFFGKKTNRIIQANLDLVFNGKLSQEEIAEIQKYSYYNMLLWIQTLIENSNEINEELQKIVKIENVEIIEKLKKNNKPIILISAHYGNMEMLSCYMNKYVTQLYQVARQSNFKKLDDFIVKARETSGSKIIFRSGALKKLINALMKKHTVSLIIDQNINEKEGQEVQFLGKKAYQTASSAVLARKFDAYIVPLAIFNQSNNTYKIKIYEPIAPIKTENEKADIATLSQLQSDAISQIILEDPKQWFWSHKRFKSHYKEIYE
ncbi:MAG: lipid A biosynthesis lauroyl acyltransferase [Candidatus Marinarcus sp.]|uniref:lipid A biosynthesis lauroyl acyltransferase n=1 Tax=Candidatus Marinarcus sp. TaxID=3100987 RepID=UPI003AFF89E9